MAQAEEKTDVRDQQNIDVDIKQADANYRPFPGFAEWTKCEVDNARWERQMALYMEIQHAPAEILARARDEVKRSAAVETGAIEGLYDSNEGITFTAGVHAAVWEAAINKMQEQERDLIQSQLAAYDYVLDFATEEQPIVEAWIRELHKVICSAQKTYEALTEIGWQSQNLPLGQYKTQPNHVLKKATGEIHSYAPVDLTNEEMHRLCQELNSSEFRGAHPILQASYAHYAFVCIHPFSDGNGRVARALASVFTYRSNSIPLLITKEQKSSYLSALGAADRGNYQPFADFIFERTIDAVRLVRDSIRTARVGSPEQTIASIVQLYRTKGNYTHTAVDDAGFILLSLLYEYLDARRAEIDQIGQGNLEYALQKDQQIYSPVKPSSRLSIKHGPQRILVRLNSLPPAEANVTLTVTLEVPMNCDRDDEITLSLQGSETYEARISEIIPTVTDSLKMRVSLWAKSIITHASQRLKEGAEASIRGKGY